LVTGHVAGASGKAFLQYLNDCFIANGLKSWPGALSARLQMNVQPSDIGVVEKVAIPAVCVAFRIDAVCTDHIKLIKLEMVIGETIVILIAFYSVVVDEVLRLRTH